MWAVGGWFTFEKHTFFFFTISRNWITLGGAVPPWSARLEMSKHQDTKK